MLKTRIFSKFGAKFPEKANGKFANKLNKLIRMQIKILYFWLTKVILLGKIKSEHATTLSDKV